MARHVYRDFRIRASRIVSPARSVAGAAVIACLFAGCASVDSVSDPSGGQSDLYAGQPELLYATEFPVESAEDALARAESALLERDYDLALYMYVQAVKYDPEDAESLYRIGALHEQRGNAALAARAYAQCIAIDPYHALALEGLGVAQFDNGEVEAARWSLERAIAADDSRSKAHNLLGVIADTNGEYERAAEHYSAALALQPRTVSILNNRAYSNYMAGKYDIAKADLLTAIDLDPTYQRAWRNLGLVHARQHDYELAEITLARVMEVHVAANDVGYIAMLDGDYAAAERLFAKAMRLSPRYYETAERNMQELRRRRDAAAEPAVALER